ncbi:MAG: sodium:solute symporter family protein [Planctomycetes bacterium]|nr:sodium:solute symporter family protein [Planctomycetota bacterium]
MVYFASIFAYLLVLTAIGVWKARQVKDQDDFALAGRSLSPWIMVLTMLAAWIGTGSIVGSAEKTYETGMAALLLPFGTFFGMILLSMVAAKARAIEASSVPEIIGRRYGPVARGLAVASLVIAYMVIVSYQFNAGGAVLEVITGDRDDVAVAAGAQIGRAQLAGGRLVYSPDRDWTGEAAVRFSPAGGGPDIVRRIRVVPPAEIVKAKEAAARSPGVTAIRANNYVRISVERDALAAPSYRIASAPARGTLALREPILTAKTATIIAAVFIILYTVLAGLMSLAYADIVTGSIILIALAIAFPLYWARAKGWDGMAAAFAAMGDHPKHMRLWGVFSPTQLINFWLPPFLLILGDANQYQRIFAARNARGARGAVTTLIFVALAIELLIIASAWTASSMTPDPEDGRYILIYAAKHYLPLPLGCLFLVTVVGIIVSTADSFLLVPATTFMKDVYVNLIDRKASGRKVLFLSRVLVVVFGVIAYLVTLAFAETTGFFDKALYAYTIYGASITPSLVAAIVWPRATRAGAIASIVAGTTVTLLWEEAASLGIDLPDAIAKLDAVLPAITISIACLVAVSLLTGRRRTA